MRSPFPGMDPYLEHPGLWPDFHNSLVVAIANELANEVAPNYYTALERRIYKLDIEDMFSTDPSGNEQKITKEGCFEIPRNVPVVDIVEENYIEVRDVITGRVITIIELLSPANKLNHQGREDYIAKRLLIFSTRTNLVEIDLLRAGQPMPIVGRNVASDYRILIRRGAQHQRAYLYPFSLREPIPKFDLPLLPGDEEPAVDLNQIVHDLYTRARFDLRLDYTKPPVPPLEEEDAAWAEKLSPA